MSRGLAPNASARFDGGPSITVTRCTNPIVWNIINGIYVVHSENHEKPVYKKKGAGDLLTSY